MSKQADMDNHANQLNPNNDEYWNSRGVENDDCYHDDEHDYDADNRANQMNPNNDAYWSSRDK